MQQPPYPSNQQPGQYYQPPPQSPRKPGFKAWLGRQRRITKIGIGCGALIVLLFACGMCSAAFSPGNQNQQQSQTTEVPKSTEVPSPTPTPKPAPKIIFEQADQATGLSFKDSVAFQASGNLKIEYSCLQSVKDGVDVQFNVLAVDNEGLVDGTAWAIKMECPDSGSNTVTVADGQYKVTVATIGGVGWSLKISQG